MQSYEYLTVPAPLKGSKIKGLKTASERYAYQVTLVLNQLAGEGWEYWRAETLPSEERKGLTGTTIVQHNLLIFRRPSAEALAETVGTSAPRVAVQSTPPSPVSGGPVLGSPVSGGAVYSNRAEPAFRSSDQS
jgi:hypothetical protein